MKEWPRIRIPDEEFERFVAERIPEGKKPSDLHMADLYLACGCVRGDPAALEAFEAYLAEVDGAYARTRPPVPLEEARQIVRTRLLVADAGPAKIALYRGEGPLRAWVRVAATRTLLNLATRLPRDRPARDSAPDVLDAGDDPELAYLKQRYGADFKLAFEEATNRLDSKEREILGHAFCTKLTVDAIGALYGVHRATAARWVTGARESLEKEVRAALKRRLGLGDADLESMLRVIRSEIELSVSRLLAPP